jgi:hypothetical protein
LRSAQLDSVGARQHFTDPRNYQPDIPSLYQTFDFVATHILMPTKIIVHKTRCDKLTVGPFW